MSILFLFCPLQVCPVIIYLGATMAFLSHIQLIPYLSTKVSWTVRAVFGVSHIEAKALGEGLFSGMVGKMVLYLYLVLRYTLAMIILY